MKQYIHQSSNRTAHIIILYKYSQVAFYIGFMILINVAQFEKVPIEQTENSHLKPCISWRLGD